MVPISKVEDLAIQSWGFTIYIRVNSTYNENRYNPKSWIEEWKKIW